MSAAEALKAARAAGIELARRRRRSGSERRLGRRQLPCSIALSRHKAEIVALLRPGRDGWSAEDWQVFFDERAGIAEFDGGLPRAEAEAQAFDCCVVEWLNRNPAALPAWSLPRLRWQRARPRPAAALRHRTHRPRLAAFALLARLVRSPEGQGRR